MTVIQGTEDNMQSASFSDCYKYRWTLTRCLTVGAANYRHIPYVAYIGLNPSTADAINDDPTMRRLRHFTRKAGYAKFIMLNLFAFRATIPKDMKAAEDPIGCGNTGTILSVTAESETCAMTVACWGTHGSFMNRGGEVTDLLQRHGVELRCFGRNADGSPKHPLYLPNDTEFEVFR